MQEPRILKTYKGEDGTLRLPLTTAAEQLVRYGNFKDVETARTALTSGVPVQTNFAYYELEKEETTPSPK